MRDAMPAKSFAQLAQRCPTPLPGNPGNVVFPIDFHPKRAVAQLAQATFKKWPGQAKKTCLFSRLPNCPACPPLKGDCRGRAKPRAVPWGAACLGIAERPDGSIQNDEGLSASSTTRARASITRARAREPSCSIGMRKMEASTPIDGARHVRLPVIGSAHKALIDRRAAPGYACDPWTIGNARRLT